MSEIEEMDLVELMEESSSRMERIARGLEKVDPSKIGIDPRVGTLLVDMKLRLLVVHKSARRSLDYYGGFEYVDDEHVTPMGDYVVYSGEADRVAEILDMWRDYKDEADEEDAPVSD